MASNLQEKWYFQNPQRQHLSYRGIPNAVTVIISGAYTRLQGEEILKIAISKEKRECRQLDIHPWLLTLNSFGEKTHFLLNSPRRTASTIVTKENCCPSKCTFPTPLCSHICFVSYNYTVIMLQNRAFPSFDSHYIPLFVLVSYNYTVIMSAKQSIYLIWFPFHSPILATTLSLKIYIGAQSVFLLDVQTRCTLIPRNVQLV